MAKYRRKDGNIKFKDATKNMSTKEKFDYFWGYYRWGVVVAIALVAIFFYSISINNPTTHLHIAITSGFAHTSNQFQFDDLEDGEALEEGADHWGEIVTNPYGFLVDIEALSDTLNQLLLGDKLHSEYSVIVQNMSINFETIPVFVTLAGAGELDIVITYQHDFDEMASLGHFRSIRDVDIDLPDHILINDYGISLKYLQIFNDYIHPSHADTELVLGIVAGTSRTQEVKNLLIKIVK